MGSGIEEMQKPRRGTRMTQIALIFTDPCASASSVQSVFHRIPSAFICVHLRLIFVSLSDGTRKANECGYAYFNAKQLSEVYLNSMIKSPQNSQITQSTASLIFANFASCYEKINNELGLTQNEQTLPEFVSVRISSLFNAFFATQSKRSTPTT